MSWPTDEEQFRLLDNEPGPITGKIQREIAVALRQFDERQRQRNKLLEKKVEEHDGFIVNFRRRLGSLVKG